MLIRELNIKNFRNIADLRLAPHPSINLFIGDNGQGKSNILEAAGLLTSGRSFRTSHDSELIAWDSPFSRLDGTLEIESEETLLSLVLMRDGAGGGRKKMSLSGAPVKKLSHFIGTIKVVIFSRHDLDIITGPPEVRRRFLDHLLSSLGTRYLLSLQRYLAIVKERNTWLRSSWEKKPSPLDDVLNEQLARQGSMILRDRTAVLEELAGLATRFYSGITAQKGAITLRYEPSFPFPGGAHPFEYFIKSLEKKKELEKMRKVTMLGPHRDDLSLFLNGKPLRFFGSQGQQRCAALALRLAERELIRNRTSRTPLLILDDSFSELDSSHKESLWETLLLEGQSFISSNFIPVDVFRKEEGTIFRVTDGRVDHHV